MNHAYIISGGKSSTRKEKIKEIYQRLKPKGEMEKDPDVHQLESETNIKIEEVRNLERVLNLKPYDVPPKIAIILEAEKLTFEAQGALLKILEEPPGETILILTAADETNLLPTIVSRCQQIYLPPQTEFVMEKEEFEEMKRFTKELLAASAGKRIKLAEKIINREEAIVFCQKQLLFWEKVLVQKPNAKVAKILRQIQKTLKYLSANVNPKLAIENLLQSL